MPTAEKTAAIEQLKETFEGAAAIFLADFTGLNVEKMTALRRKCREAGVEFSIVKNTLAIKATQGTALSDLQPHFKGPTALATSTEDPTAPARVLMDFHKEHKRPEVKLGFVDGQIISAEQVKALANLPTRDQLISQVMQLALAPAQSFVYALNDSITKLVRTVDAVRDGMEKGTIQGGAAPAAEAPAAEADESAADSSDTPDEGGDSKEDK